MGTGSPVTLHDSDAAGSSDDDLLVSFARGSNRAAAELTQRLLPRAYSIALRMLGDPAEAEDMAQEAMLELWRIAPRWSPGQARVSTWLFRVVSNRCIDVIRRRRGGSEPLEDANEPADPGVAAVDRLQDNERAAALQAALLTLPDRQRQAVVLRHIEDLANPEIAEIMGLSVEAVESLTARGKRTLARKLAGRRADLGYQDE